MKVIVCLDKSNGMLFNKRRQSRDDALNNKVAELVGDGKLYLSEYSSKLFEGKCALEISDDLGNVAGENDFCFYENTPVDTEKANEIYIFKWNRDYPGDTYFNFSPKDNGFKCIKKEDFEGTSHKKITLEIYRRD